MKVFCLGAVLCLVALSACSKKSAENEVWIYTSTYKEVIALYDGALQKAFPDIKVQWYQGGSENVSAKILAEQAGGHTKADLMMTSDLFFFQEMKNKSQLLAPDDEAIKKLPPRFVDGQKLFVINRIPVMVLAYNTQLPEADRPKSFQDLTLPKFKGKITMPSPLESGSALAAVLALHKLYGEKFFKDLRANDVLAAGGNGSTLARLQSGEKSVGMVLMENVLQAKEKGQNSVEFLIPSEGSIAIPSGMAIFRSTAHAEMAQKIFAWFLTPEAQELLVKGWVYSPMPEAKAPLGAPQWSALPMLPWSLPDLEKLGSGRQSVKELFQKIVLN